VPDRDASIYIGRGVRSIDGSETHPDSFPRERWSQDRTALAGQIPPKPVELYCDGGDEGSATLQGNQAIGGVDIGGTKIAVGIVSFEGKILATEECPTAQELGFGSAVDRISRMLRSCAERANAAIHGIGIGCTGPVYPLTGEVGDVEFLKAWKGANLVEALETPFGVRAALENDADAATLGEAFWGAGRGKGQVLFVTVGTGIGVGIVLNGELYRGVDGSHPEIGHQVIDAGGPPCYCGARGCWEVVAAGPAMTARMNEHGTEMGLSAKAICEMAAAGHPLARRAVELEAHYLGLGLANLVTIFCPEVIVLGGSVMASASLFLDGIRAEIRRNCTQVPCERTEVRLASLGPHAAIIGAARAWHHRFITNGERDAAES
jgi:glucokinase